MIGIVVAIVALLTATVIGVVWRSRNGVLRTKDGQDQASDSARLTAADLGGPLGEQATMVQFSSAFCAPCRATRRILDEVAQMADGVRYVDIDAESRLDLVRRLGIVRTPTVLIVDTHGRIVRRGSGQPRKADVIAALGVAIPS